MIDRRADAAEADQAVALLRALVRAESVNPPGDTTGPVRVAQAALAGLPVEVVAAEPTKPNLLVILANGEGPSIHLNAHLDTVPPGDPAAWSVPPLDLTEREGRLHGLGTGNMKGAAAAMILAVRRLAVSRDRWRGTLVLSLVADECVFGPHGAAHLLAQRPDLRGDALICGEGPGAMNLAVAEKGLMWVRLRAAGRSGQGMLTTRGSSAAARLAAALVAADAWNEIRAAPPLRSLDHAGNAEGMRLSVNVGHLRGGAGHSQAMSEAEAWLDLRIPPGLTREAIASRLDALTREHPLSWEEVKGWEPNWSDPASAPACAVREAAARLRGRPPLDVTRLPASDAARWRSLGVPAVCFGPQPTLAAGPDDFVHRADLLDCVAIYAGAAAALLR
ncbi:M20 family metallopeptidase [Rubellimicrobium sp. CFH 75288]|uniref:M20 family metallopeptidase n=1 Tax=Rubellimicrobium sp. CFH 75288 TaxID=2697034 RepID=UPI001412C77C|nr:M20/M25/M40 family metallo-hydrolase [Rubellimicrobium sp. CFH 75288]NAZ35303.1 M20/M25/M40 family metallo-hydrolase [Rubellimicrobium sp. CFH 75288]